MKRSIWEIRQKDAIQIVSVSRPTDGFRISAKLCGYRGFL
nr:MAG TPA: hypothetical protein [Caudoviricetes sp.]DAR51063.1 MAG TPA: hypothetical protein [Caudoviricetes sp.]